MSYLMDTNILLRLINGNDLQHAQTQQAVTTLQEQKVKLYIVSQNLVEFWAVSTRPINANGLGLTVAETAHESSLLKQLFTLRPDDRAVFTAWENLVVKYEVKGRQVHDTRLVAAMIVHEITHLLTFNTQDFNRFSEITAISPQFMSSN